MDIKEQKEVTQEQKEVKVEPVKVTQEQKEVKVEPIKAAKETTIEKKGKKVTVISILLFIFSALCLAYAIFLAIDNITNISGMMSSGQVDLAKQSKDVVKFFVEASLPKLAYAIISCMLGIFHIKLTAIENK
ncbi:MAG: hypothetical protein ACRC6X_05900 [Culicoidibacterales bacterium]